MIRRVRCGKSGERVEFYGGMRITADDGQAICAGRLRIDGAGSPVRTFTFDAAGNMTEKKVVTDSATVTETRSFNDVNEITQNVIGGTTWTYTHDNNGNLTSKSDGTDTWDYTWDEDNLLTEVKLNTVTQVTYEYDSMGRLLKRLEGSLTTMFHWSGWNLVREEKSGSVTEVTDYKSARRCMLGRRTQEAPGARYRTTTRALSVAARRPYLG